MRQIQLLNQATPHWYNRINRRGRSGAQRLIRIVFPLPTSVRSGVGFTNLGLFDLVLAFCLLASALAQAQVPYQRLLTAEKEPGNWMSYSNGYQSHRFSPLKQITPENVSRLKTAWVYQNNYSGGRVETSPIVVDGVMYVTSPPTQVAALDLRTGRPLVTWQRAAARAATTLRCVV